jgi:hypothetical protein
VRYETTTEKGSAISATLIRESHIEILVYPAIGGVYVEWHWDINRAAQRFQWLLKNF